MESEFFLARPTRGSLLIATPLLDDPNFHRAVVFVLEHTDDGTLGLVINRPTNEIIAEGLQPWLLLASDPAVIFDGGPVERQALLALAAVDPEATAEVLSPIDGTLASIDLSQPPDAAISEIRQLRIFRGYSGWSAGQLDDELAQGSWLVTASDAFDVFSPHPQGLWRNVLRRSGGRNAVLADAPDDLSWN